MTSTLQRFCMVQKLLLERCSQSVEHSPRVFLTPVLPRRRLRQALDHLLEATVLLRRQDAQPSSEPGELALVAASAAAELAFLIHHPQAPAPVHIEDLMERLQGLPSALVPATPREHTIECLWHLGGVASGLRHGPASQVRRQALLAAGHLVLLAEVTGALDAVLAGIDPADDDVMLPELSSHV